MTGLCTLVLTGAPLTSRASELAVALTQAGWEVHLVATPSAAAWVDEAALVEAVGHAPAAQYRAPGEPRRGGRPDAVVVAPATFNTINKLAAGIADSYAHGVLCDALGTATPLVIVPMVNNRLWGHPAWPANLQLLSKAGARFVDINSGGSEPAPVQSGTGDDVVAAFDPPWIVRQLADVPPR